MRAAVLLLSAILPVIRAQDVAVIQRGDTHLEGFGSFSIVGGVNPVTTQAINPVLGQSEYLTPSNNAGIGARFEYFLTRSLGIQVEYSYLAGGTLAFNQDYVPAEEALRTRRVNIEAHSSARVGTGSVIWRLPMINAPRFVPYAGVGAGVVRTHYELKRAEIGFEPGRTSSASSKENDPIGSVQAGSRYYFTERVGMHAELRLIAGPQVRTMVRASVGFFVKVY